MKIVWNKLAKKQWQGAYNGYDIAINSIGGAGYQYLIWDAKGKLINSDTEKTFRKALRVVKKILRSNCEYF